jgi:hypothetical protein
LIEVEMTEMPPDVLAPGLPLFILEVFSLPNHSSVDSYGFFDLDGAELTAAAEFVLETAREAESINASALHQTAAPERCSLLDNGQKQLLFILVADFRHQPVGSLQERTQGPEGLEVFIFELTFQNDRVGRNSPQQGIDHFLPGQLVPVRTFRLGQRDVRPTCR